MTGWLVAGAAAGIIVWLAYDICRRVDRYEADLDWTPPAFRSSRDLTEIDRQLLLDLPYSPFLSDEEAIRLARSVRATIDALPEVAA